MTRIDLRLAVLTAILLAAGWMPAANAQLTEPLELDCLIEPHMVVKLGAPVIGVLQSVEVERGDVVKKGAVVARIDARAERASMALARARLEFAERRVERNQALYDDDLLSAQEQDEMATERQMAELVLKQQRTALEMRTVRTPIDAVVVERLRSPGELVQETEIFELAQINPLNVEVVVPAEYFGGIALGSMAEVVPAAPIGGSYEAKVTIVDRVIDAASETFGVRLEIPNRDLRIPAGIGCAVAFPIAD